MTLAMATPLELCYCLQLSWNEVASYRNQNFLWNKIKQHNKNENEPKLKLKRTFGIFLQYST